MRYVPANELAGLINARLGRWAKDPRWGARAGCDGRVVLSHRAAAEIARRLGESGEEFRLIDMRRADRSPDPSPDPSADRQRITWRPDLESE
jgi:hypothetical protein